MAHDDGDGPAPQDDTLGMSVLRRDSDTVPAWLKPLVAIARARRPARHALQYWAGDPEPWRDASGASIAAQTGVIAREERLRLQIEEQDARAYPTVDAHADGPLRRGQRVAGILALTFHLDLWSWTTAEVQSLLIKPATEAHRHCRFADLPFIAPRVGKATILVCVVRP